MAVDQNIIAFGQQPSPLVRGAQAVGNAFEVVRQGMDRRDERNKQANRQEAIGKVSQAFLDTSDKDMTNALLLEGINLDPEAAFAAINSAGGFGAKQSKDLFERLTQGLNEEDKAEAVAIKLGLKPRAVGSGAITLAQSGQTGSVAESQAEIERSKAEAKAVGKAEGEAKSAKLIANTKSSIQSAIQQEKDRAKSAGEAESQYKNAQAALPSLKEVVGQLKSLAPVATNTYSGRAFDTVAKELGFSGTKGGTARAKFIAIVDNQVLPLLKQTFGSAFTVKEGENLKATLGDPDASSDAKIAQLDSFIESKIRELEVSERQLGINTDTLEGSGSQLSESAMKYIRN